MAKRSHATGNGGQGAEGGVEMNAASHHQEEGLHHDVISTTSAMSTGEYMAAWLRDYFLGFVPPHIRRKGLRMPPIRVSMCVYV